MSSDVALVLVDLQNDFVPGGALGVPHGDEVVPIANAMAQRFDLVIATQDWHPPDHQSFAAAHPGHKVGDVIDLHGLPQILWPVHCVQGTRGAEFVAEFDRSRVARVFRKGVDREIDSYSALFDNAHRRSTGLGEYLRERRVRHIYLMGLATDYCVKFSALDARQMGLEVTIIEDGCRGVELKPGDVARAMDEMRAAGAKVVTSDELR